MKEQETLEYLIAHLDRYGNVYLKDNPEYYIQELEKRGYKCKLDTYLAIDDAQIIINEKCFVNRKGRRRYTTDYVLTRIKEWTMNNFIYKWKCSKISKKRKKKSKEK